MTLFAVMTLPRPILVSPVYSPAAIGVVRRIAGEGRKVPLVKQAGKREREGERRGLIP